MSERDEKAQLKRVPVASTPEQRFRDYLQSRSMRNTEQRKRLLQIVTNQHEHFDADQLIERLPQRGEPGYVSRPTVYRTLGEFVDAGLLRKFVLDGRSVYEHDYGYPQHDHLYCGVCETLIEFESSALLRLRDEVAREHQFQVHGHRLIVTGICETCRKQKQRVRRRVDRV